MDDETTPTGMIRIGRQPVIEPGRARRRFPRWLVPAGAALAVLIAAGVVTGVLAGRHANAVAAASSPSPGPATFQIFGNIQLEPGQFYWNDTPTETCWGGGGYNDLKVGGPVVVTDAAGKTVGVGQIDSSRPQTDINKVAEGCLLMFSVKGVTDGSAFYGVAVGHRAAVQFPRAELGTAINLTI